MDKRKTTYKHISTFCTFFMILAFQVSAQYNATVLDANTNAPIPYANVYFPDSKTGTSTDTLGHFTLNTTKQEVLLQVSCIGYKTYLQILTLTNKDITIRLEPSQHQLQEITVSACGSHLQGENVMNVEQVSIGSIANSGVSLTDKLTSIAGVDNMSTGLGIGKPLIRGLGANRIAIYANGMRMETQQWGDEHGLGVGEEGFEQVEVIKGAASLLYGSDALGGVIFFAEEPHAKQNSIEAKAASEYNTNTNGWHNTAKLKLSTNRWHYNIYAGLTNHGNYHDGNNTEIDNSAFNTKDFKTSLSYSGNKIISSLNYSYLNECFGLTEAEEEDAKRLFTTSKSLFGNMNAPFQRLNTHIISTENTFLLPKSANIKLNAGFMSNQRQEYEDANEAALDMMLNTASYNLRLQLPKFNKLSLIFGSQGMYQTNRNAGEETLIPNATTAEAGLYSMAEYSYKNDSYLQFGARIDVRKISTSDIVKDDSVFRSAFEHSYPAFSVSTGVYHTLNSYFTLRATAATGFRCPNTFELSSYGVHEGTYRFETGNPNLNTEKTYQFDVSLDYHSEHVKFAINPFINHINDYIFLNPSNETMDNLPVYYYRQTNALLYGGEAALHFHPHALHWLHFETSYNCVFGRDSQNDFLPLMPAQKIKAEVSATFSFSKIKQLAFYLQNVYAFPQRQVSAFETPSADYDIVNAGITMSFRALNQTISLDISVTNLFNVRYFEYTSRYRTIGIANAGRNLMFRLSIPLKFNLKQALLSTR